MKHSFFQKFNSVLLILVICMVALTGCGKSSSNDQVMDTISAIDGVYYLNREETKINQYELNGTKFDITNRTSDEAVKTIIAALSETPTDIDSKATLGVDVTLKEYYLDSEILVLNFDSNYHDLSPVAEVLFRAALVRSFSSIEEIKGVAIHVEGEELCDNSGIEIGVMKADDFIYNAGDEMNSYEQTNLVLYFASPDGTKLVKTNKEVVYSSNISKEKLVVEQLIAGPERQGMIATLLPDRKINSVTTKDGVCYVNLTDPSTDALALIGGLTEEVTLYSIVNSLCELPSVNKVQISIDGDTDRVFRESMTLDKAYERNLELVQ